MMYNFAFYVIFEKNSDIFVRQSPCISGILVPYIMIGGPTIVALVFAADIYRHAESLNFTGLNHYNST